MCPKTAVNACNWRERPFFVNQFGGPRSGCAEGTLFHAPNAPHPHEHGVNMIGILSANYESARSVAEVPR